MRNFLTLLILGTFIVCGCAKKEPSDKVVATVNGEPVYLRNFKRELALRVKRNPSLKITPDTMGEMLDMIIDRKLIIQEAMKKNLSEEQRFVDTIQAFWEQTLIRDFIDYRNKEAEHLIYVTDSEIRDYYERLKTRMTFNMAKRKKLSDIDMLTEKLKEGETIEWDDTVSLSYEDVSSQALAKAFEMPPGETAVFEEENAYYLIFAVDKETIQTPPLEEVRGDIKRKIVERKEMSAFNEWLKSKKSTSDIKINRDVLQKINNDRQPNL